MTKTVIDVSRLSKAATNSVTATVFTVLLGILSMAGCTLLLWQSLLGQTLMVLTRLSLHLIPPFFWLAGLLIVILWLMVMAKAWRR